MSNQESFEVVSGPKGIWGWNTIPILNLAFCVVSSLYFALMVHIPPFFNGSMSGLLSSHSETYNPMLAILVCVEVVVYFVMVAFSVYALGLVWRRSVRYPKIAKRFFWGVAIFTALDNIAAMLVGVNVDPSVARRVIGSVMFAWIWASYYAKSLRIKNTFVNP